MKLQDKKLLHTKTAKALKTDLAEAVNKLAKLKLDLKTNQLKDTSQIKKIKNKIAVIKTIIHFQLKADLQAGRGKTKE